MERHHHATANVAITDPIDTTSQHQNLGNGTVDALASFKPLSELFDFPMDLSRGSIVQGLPMTTTPSTLASNGTAECSSTMMFSPNPRMLPPFNNNTIDSTFDLFSSCPPVPAASNLSTSSTMNINDSSDFIKQLMSSIPCLKASTGIVPHVSAASCIPVTLGQQISETYQARIQANKDQPSPQKRSRVQKDVRGPSQPASRAQSSSDLTSIVSVIQPAAKRNPSVEQVSAKNAESPVQIVYDSKQNLQIGQAQPLAQSTAQISSAIQSQSMAIQQSILAALSASQPPETDSEKALSAGLSETERKLLADKVNQFALRLTGMVSQQMASLFVERDKLMLKVKQETQSILHLFNKTTEDEKIWEPTPETMYEKDLFNVVYQGSADFIPDRDMGRFAKQVLDSIQSVKQKTYNETTVSVVLSFTVDDTEIVAQGNREQVRIRTSTVMAIFNDGNDRNFFGIVYNPSKTMSQIKVAVFCSHTQFVCHQIVKSVCKKIIGKPEQPRRTVQSLCL